MVAMILIDGLLEIAAFAFAFALLGAELLQMRGLPFQCHRVRIERGGEPADFPLARQYPVAAFPRQPQPATPAQHAIRRDQRLAVAQLRTTRQCFRQGGGGIDPQQGGEWPRRAHPRGQALRRCRVPELVREGFQ